MSHAHDNTLLQRMGFRDPDRRLPKHDHASMQLASEPVWLVLASSVHGYAERLSRIQCDLEHPIQKGDGAYRTTIGFADALLTWGERFEDRPWCRIDGRDVEAAGPCCLRRQIHTSMIVEIKSRIDDVGSLLRQMNLYREYSKCDRYLVWSLHDEDREFGSLLRSQRIGLLVGPSLFDIGFLNGVTAC